VKIPKGVYIALISMLALLLTAQFVQVSATQMGTQTPIQHVIVIMQENRTFDNFFWTYPGVINGSDQLSSLCMPKNPTNPSLGCLHPTYTSNPVSSGDLAHTYTASIASYNTGKMNGFLKATKDNPQVMNYYNASTVPDAWYFAEHYVLADNAFSSVMSYSQPNHWYMVAGNAPQASVTETGPTEKSQCVSNGHITLSTCVYINEAQKIPTMADILNEYGVSWKYYDTPLFMNATLSQAMTGTCHPNIGCSAYAYWSPLLAKNETYGNTAMTPNLVARSSFFTDLANGTLPDVSWVIPSTPISDHAPANVTLGE